MANYRFGKRAPRLDYRTLKFEKYLMPSLAAPAPACNTLPRVYKGVGVNDPKALFPMDGNDTLGDCTIAGLAHATTTYRGLVGEKSIMAHDDVVALYKKLTGGPDTGLHEIDVLNYWRKNAVAGSQILAYVSINPKNHTHVQQAIQLFGAVYLGFQVQQNAIEDFHARRAWTPGPLTKDGHAVVATGYDASGLTMLTWGDTQQGTWAWWDECVDEAYAILPPEAENPKFAPGFNLVKLRQDLTAVTN